MNGLRLLTLGILAAAVPCGLLTSLPRIPFQESAEWIPFAPAPGNTAGSLIDLRSLNERFAGENGRILAKDGRFVHEKSGRPVRFWGVNGPPHELKGEELRECARMLARFGVNLVRIHGPVFDEKTGALRPERINRIAEIVEAMKQEGIYSHLSIYFPLWFRPQPNLSWLPGYDGNRHPFAALQFNPAFQARYREWWTAVLSAPIHGGRTLGMEPALMGVEIQNEDSYFFWTFSEANIPDPQLRILEKQFGDWLVKRHGSIQAAFRSWNGARLARDNEAEGRVGFRPLWNIFNEKTARDRETAAFLLESQKSFYEQTAAFLRSSGFRGLITCSNWSTASPEVFGPLEKLSYTVGDFVDRHGYFGCFHKGENAEWSIRDGHTYADRSALRFDPEEPGKPKLFTHPAMDVHYNDLPSMISETTYTRPNRYRSEAPLYYAVYGALQDSDSVVHFALDGARFDVKPQFWMQPWTLMAPSQMGQFPAAALIYRKGLISEGALLADLKLKVSDLLDLKGTPLPQEASFDELRLKDVPQGTALKAGNRIDPLIHYAGRTRVTFTTSEEPSTLADLKPFVNRAQQTVTSSTGQIRLDYGKGVLTLNAPAVQGAGGNLQAAGPVNLSDLTVESDMDLAHIVAVSLDGLPLRSSRRILLQAMSEERNSGFQTVRQGNVNRIQSIGRNPWEIRRLRGTVRLNRPDAARLKVTALDGSGVAVGEVGRADRITLQPGTLYYLIQPGAAAGASRSGR